MAVNNRELDGMARIKVIGVGGGGSNAVSRMFRERVPSVEYMVVNTDAQALVRCDVPLKIRVGDQLTGGKELFLKSYILRQFLRNDPESVFL